MLVACKKDRFDEAKHQSPDEGRELAMKFQCTHIECSAFTGENVNQVFEQLATEILDVRYAHAGGAAQYNKDKKKDNKGSLRSL